MSAADFEDERMQQALTLARQAIGLSDPNPRVGCVLADTHQRVIGAGYTQQAGGPHAEVMALAAARAAGHSLSGATAWVTLEPCAHHGRTPPCCDALIDAGLARVVIAAQDPFPKVSGRGIDAMRAAGIQVEMAAPAHEVAARELNIGFFSRMERGRPWIRMKVATTLDGRIALVDGRSQWITGPQARQDTHAWRKRASAVLTGIGTVLADDPRLDVRLVNTAHQPMRLVLDSRLRISPRAKVLRPPGKAVVAYSAREQPTAARAAALDLVGVEVLPLQSEDPAGRLREVVQHLTQREANEIHVEAGGTLNAALIAAGLVDELLLYVSPSLMGPGRALAELSSLNDLSEMRRYAFVEVRGVGPDLCLRLREEAAALGQPAGF